MRDIHMHKPKNIKTIQIKQYNAWACFSSKDCLILFLYVLTFLIFMKGYSNSGGYFKVQLRLYQHKIVFRFISKLYPGIGLETLGLWSFIKHGLDCLLCSTSNVPSSPRDVQCERMFSPEW